MKPPPDHGLVLEEPRRRSFKLRRLGAPEGLLDGFETVSQADRIVEHLPPPQLIRTYLGEVRGWAALVYVYETRPCRGAYDWPYPWVHCKWFEPTARHNTTRRPNWEAVQGRAASNQNAKVLVHVVHAATGRVAMPPIDPTKLQPETREVLKRAIRETRQEFSQKMQEGIDRYWEAERARRAKAKKKGVRAKRNLVESSHGQRAKKEG